MTPLENNPAHGSTLPQPAEKNVQISPANLQSAGGVAGNNTTPGGLPMAHAREHPVGVQNTVRVSVGRHRSGLRLSSF